VIATGPTPPTTPTLTPEQYYDELIRQARNRPHDYYITSDGSGHEDGLGGYCARVQPNLADTSVFYLVYGCSNSTDTYRMELSGLLNALNTIMYKDQLWGTASMQRLYSNPKTVMWFTDNQALAHSVCRDWNNPARPQLFERNGPLDLWHAFGFFEPMFRITPVWTEREASIMRLPDFYASTMRAVVKNFAQTYPPTDFESFVR
jgi:ribonuclease HI